MENEKNRIEKTHEGYTEVEVKTPAQERAAEESEAREGGIEDQEPGQSQKRNQNDQKNDPLAA